MQRQITIVAIIALTIPFAAALVGCGGQTETVQTQRAISHALTGGTQGFYFLPPIAPAYPYEGVFNPNLSLRVEIHQVDSTGNLLDPDVLVTTFNMAAAGAPADEGIRVDSESQLYIVNWHTDRSDLVDHGIYRIYVRRSLDNAEYGFADVQIFTSMKEAKSLVTGDTVALVDGRTLPIKFRIELGALSLIAFMSDRDGNWEIYVMNSDGANQVNLTNNPAVEGLHWWSPDGNKIAFTSDRDGNHEVYVMNSDGTNQTRLTNNPAWDGYASWSPDGSKIAFTSDRDGNQEVYVMNSDGTNQTRLTNNPAGNIQPSWSPDGSRIVFTSARDGDFEVYAMNSDGTNQINLTNNSAGDENPSWSPDGSKIAFDSQRDGDFEVYAMNSDGSNQTNLTNNPASDSLPSWSPDGSKIAFTSRRDGNAEVYVMNSDGSDQVRLTNNPARDAAPSWSPF